MLSRPVLLSLVAAGSSVACAPTVYVSRMRPAEANLKANTRLAVTEITGNDAGNLSAELQSAIGGNGHFQLVDRSSMNAIVREQKLAVDGLTGGGPQLGALEAAGAFLSGNANYDYRENHQTYNTTCSTMQNGKMVSVPCLGRSIEGVVNYNALLKVVDTGTGAVVTAKNYSETRTDRHAAKGNETLYPIDRDQLINGVRTEVVGKFMRVIAPYEVTESVELVTDDAIPSLAQGNEYAKARTPNWVEAQQHYGTAVATVTQGVGARVAKPETKAKAHYSLGLALVMQGDFPNGITQLTLATRHSPDNRYMEMLSRARQWAKEAEKLSSLGAGASSGQATIAP